MFENKSCYKDFELYSLLKHSAIILNSTVFMAEISQEITTMLLSLCYASLFYLCVLQQYISPMGLIKYNSNITLPLQLWKVPHLVLKHHHGMNTFISATINSRLFFVKLSSFLV